MLWMALHFHSLPLEIFARGVPQTVLLAVVSSSGVNATVVACNSAARRCGVRDGMPVSAAWALASDLKIAVRDAGAERAALERIAAWALQFTPTVNITPPADVLLELAGSLKLFGGLHHLRVQVRKGLSAIGYSAVIACAPTPFAAQLFARAGLSVKIERQDALLRGLGRLPVELLDQPPGIISTLRDIGVRTLGDCLALPRDGLARRFGPNLLDGLDRALGSIPDPRANFVPPPAFAASLELPAPVIQSEMLLFAARRLLVELCGFLAATGSGAQHLRFVLAHEDRVGTQVEMKLVAASRDPVHLSEILRERLSRVSLPCPATAITLTSEGLLPLSSHNLSFLPDSSQRTRVVARLVERLHARLGDDAVAGLAAVADHRPECAWRVCKPGNDGVTDELPYHPPFSRPLWLLHCPQPLKEVASIPCCDGPLTLLAGPERIESGWWDEGEVARDYFIARNYASLLWIYRERRGSGCWYLHGIFG